VCKVYEPYIRARLGTAAHFCEVVDNTLGVQVNPKFGETFKMLIYTENQVPKPLLNRLWRVFLIAYEGVHLHEEPGAHPKSLNPKSLKGFGFP